MKKVLCILLMVTFLIGISSAEESGTKIEINGINVIFVDGDRILRPIEKDGVLYVPAEAFLDVMKIQHSSDGDVLSVYVDVPSAKAAGKPAAETAAIATEQSAEAAAKPENYYELLSDDEKELVNNIILWTQLNMFSVVDIQNVYISGDSEVVVTLALDDTQGFRVEHSFFSEESGQGLKYTKPSWTPENATEAGYNTELLNKAYQEKYNEPGYAAKLAGKYAINQQLIRIQNEEAKLGRWKEAGTHEKDYEKQEQKIENEKQKLEELRKKYNIYE